MRNLLKTFNGANGQKGGAAIITVVIMAFVMVTTLSTVYVYLVNRAKYHQRIKNAYVVTHVMEELGKLVRQARDTAQANPACAPQIDIGGGVFVCFPACGMEPGCNATYGNTCVRYLNQSYCLDGSDIGGGGPVSMNQSPSSYYAKFKVYEKRPATDSRFISWYRRLDKFFDSRVRSSVEDVAARISPLLQAQVQRPTFMGWILREAYAGEEVIEEGGTKEEGTDLGVICSESPSLPTCQTYLGGGEGGTTYYPPPPTNEGGEGGGGEEEPPKPTRICGLSAEQATQAAASCRSRMGLCACLCDAGIVTGGGTDGEQSLGGGEKGGEAGGEAGGGGTGSHGSVCGDPARVNTVNCVANPTDNRCVRCDTPSSGCAEISLDQTTSDMLGFDTSTVIKLTN